MSIGRLYLAAPLAAAFIAVLAGCGGGAPSSGPVPPPPQSPTAKTATIALSAVGAQQTLPSVSGISSSIVLPGNTAAANATLMVTVTTTAPQGITGIPARSAQSLLYFTLQASSNATFNGVPHFTIALPSAPQSQGAFYAWMYDVAAKIWTNLGSVTVSGNQVTFGGTAQKLTFNADASYVIVPFTAVPYASCPTPTPTPTPTPPPAPTGKFYIGAFTPTTNSLTNDTLLTYGESNGQLLASLPLGFPDGVYATNIQIGSNGSTVYIGATSGSGFVNGVPGGFTLPGLTIVNTATNTIVHQTAIAGGIGGGALSPDQTKYYGIGENSSGTAIFVFDTSSGSLLQTLQVPSAGPNGGFEIYLNSTGTTAYYPGGGGGVIYKVALGTGTVTSIPAPGTMGVAIDASGTKLFGSLETTVCSPTCVTSGGIAVLDASTGSQIGTINPPPGYSALLPNDVYGHDESADRSTLVAEAYPSSSQNYGISVISTSTATITGTFVGNFTSNAVNTDGTFGIFWIGQDSDFPTVTALSLPLGQTYYTLSLPPSLVPVSGAAQ